MPTLIPDVGADPRDWVTPEHLNVAPQLLGAPLARPRRRLLAISVDVLVIALLSNFGNPWLLAAIALPAWLHLRARARPIGAGRRRLGWVLAAVLLAIGVQQVWVGLGEQPPASRGHSHLHLHLYPAPADDDAKELAEAADRVASAPGLSPQQTDAARIAILEAQLEVARSPKPFDLKKQLSMWADEVGLGLGWTIAYFALLPAWWNGQTLGKRLFGLRVVELTGKPVSVMLAFKRYGGYAAGMATGMFGFAQVFWDANRQAIQDKTAHTVVVDLRRAPREAAVAAADDRTLSPPATGQEP